jgi:DNA transposition AAA+ family ATPase
MNKFIKTKQYKQFAEFCKACRRDQYIGLCYGPAGAGKTESAHYYTHWEKLERHIQYNVWERPPLTFSIKNLHSLVYTPQILAQPKDIIHDIKRLQREFSLLKEKSLYPGEIPDNVRMENRNFAELVIIDEAERLKPQAFELIRELYDQNGTSFIFIGMPGIEKIIERFPQLYPRVGFVHQFTNLGKKEVEYIISKQFSKIGVCIEEDNFSDQEAVSTIIRMTNGNFRLINRLLKQSYRIMQVNCMASLNTEILEAARKCLLIGEK